MTKKYLEKERERKKRKREKRERGGEWDREDHLLQ
jgi:hypothetical protein